MTSNSQKSSTFEPKTSQTLSNSPKKELAESSYIPAAENNQNIYIKEYTQAETSESPNIVTRTSGFGASPQHPVSTSGDQNLTTGYSAAGIGSALTADNRLNPLSSQEFAVSSPFGVPKETNFTSSYEYKSSVTGNPSVNTYDLKTSNADHIATPYPFPSASTYTPYQGTTTYSTTYGTTDLKNSSTEKTKQSGLLARDSYPVSRDEQRTTTQGYTILKPLSQSGTAEKQRNTFDSHRYQSTQLGTPFDSVKKTEAYLASPPFKRDELEGNQGDEYLISEPRVSKTTTYTIENPLSGDLKTGRSSLGAAGSILRTPERRTKSISGSPSPLNELKQALKGENVQISKIVIETVENFDGENPIYGSSGKKGLRESLHNRLDIVMEELIPQVFGNTTDNLLSTEKVKQSHISYETPAIPSYQEPAKESYLKTSSANDYLLSSETAAPVRSYEYESTYKSTYTPVQETVVKSSVNDYLKSSSYEPAPVKSDYLTSSYEPAPVKTDYLTSSTYEPAPVKNDYLTSSTYEPVAVKSYTYDTTLTNYQNSYGTGQENVYKSPPRDYLSSYETANPITSSYAYESTYTTNYKDSLNPLKESIARSESKRVSAAEIGGTISAINERMKNLDDFLERKSTRLGPSTPSSQGGEFRGESDLVTRTFELEKQSGSSPKEKRAFFSSENSGVRQRLDQTIQSTEEKKVPTEEVKKTTPKKDSAFFAKATIAFIVLLLCAILFFEFRMEAEDFDNLMDS